MALTPAEITSIRRKIGDTASPSAFSDDEINATYDEQGTSTLTVVALFDELLVSAARLTDYTQNASSEKRSQVFSQLEKLRDKYQALANKEAKDSKRQVVIAKTSKPRREKDTP